MDREELKQVFFDSMNLIAADNFLSDAVNSSQERQKFIPEGQYPIYNEYQPQDYKTKLFVTKSGTFDAARKYEGKTAALNFASATNPGGGVLNGSSAQEECLCRVSTLYKCLTYKNVWFPFYKAHRQQQNNLHNNDIIYTPDVVVFKNDNCELLPKDEWKKIDVITCAAPNLREKNNEHCNPGEAKNLVKVSNDELYNIHLSRAKRILQVAAENRVENIVLGAFGCGAFKNDPKVVAKAWHDAVYAFDTAFKNIEFAVYCNKYNSQNYEIFNEII